MRAVSRRCWKSHCSLTSPLSQAWRCCSQTCLCYSELSIGDSQNTERAVPFIPGQREDSHERAFVWSWGGGFYENVANRFNKMEKNNNNNFRHA